MQWYFIYGILAAPKSEQVPTRMREIPDFNDFELETVQNTVNERYCRDLEFEQADVEIRLSPIRQGTREEAFSLCER